MTKHIVRIIHKPKRSHHKAIALIVHANPNCRDAALCDPHGETGPVTYSGRLKAEKPDPAIGTSSGKYSDVIGTWLTGSPINLAKPEPHCEPMRAIDSSPQVIFIRQVIDEAYQTLAAGYRESALFHLTALREYRLDYKYFECV